MTDIELLPLPEPMRVLDTREKDAAEAWCRANIAARDAQIAQLEKANDQLHAHGDRMHAEIERLRAEREVIGAEAVKYAGKSGRLEARAERLAEVLRECIDNREGLAYESEILDRARDLLRAQDAEISPNQDDTREARG